MAALKLSHLDFTLSSFIKHRSGPEKRTNIYNLLHIVDILINQAMTYCVEDCSLKYLRSFSHFLININKIEIRKKSFPIEQKFGVAVVIMTKLALVYKLHARLLI